MSINDEYAAAMLSALDGIAAVVGEIRDRLAAPSGDVEPAPDHRRGVLLPLREPAPPATPAVDEPVPLTEPATEPGHVEPQAEPTAAPTADHPPRAGRGSSLVAWQAFAAGHNVQHDSDASRDDIIAACESAGVIERTG